jgi:GNAT superfamily N-acetyltransferase
MMIECHLAGPAEVAAGLVLVPQAAEPGSQLLIAFNDGELAGAASLLWRSTGEPAGFPLAVHVLPAQQRKGVGRALVAAAADMVRGETIGLWTEPLDGGSAALQFALACGCQPKGRTFLLNAPLDHAIAKLRMKTDAARAAGAAAARAVIRPLADVEVAVAASTVAAELGGGVLLTDAKIRGLMTAQNAVPPHIALIDGQLAGVALCHAAGTRFTVEALVVIPAWRGAHLSQMMMRHLMEQAAGANCLTTHFQSEEHVVQTFDILERAGDLEIPERLRCFLPVTA